MSSFSGSPRLLKGGIVLLDPDSSAVLRIITLQYNSDTLTPTLAPKSLKESGSRSETLWLLYQRRRHTDFLAKPLQAWAWHLQAEQCRIHRWAAKQLGKMRVKSRPCEEGHE